MITTSSKQAAIDKSLNALQLKARDQAYTLLSGHNLSQLYGEGYDFAQLREYQIGDDIRKINWMVTAKLSKPYIKDFHSNRELSVVICTFMDASLYFGSGNSKQKKLTEVATLLAYATHHQADLFTGLCYTQKHTYITPPTKQLYHINQFSKTLYETSLLGSTLDINTATKDLFTKVSKPSLLFILSDFLQEVDFSLLSQKHEVIAIIVRDKDEELPINLAEVSLTKPQNNQYLTTYFGQRSIKTYLKRLRAHDKTLIRHFTDYNIRYVKIATNDEVIGKLQSLFY